MAQMNVHVKRGGGAMTMQRFCRRRALIASILTIPASQVTEEMVFSYEMGHLESGACSPLWLGHYLRDREPVLTVAPYTVRGGYAEARTPFADDDWPGLPVTLLTGEGEAYE